MLKINDCPSCRGKARVGLFFGMYQVFAVCECTNCDTSVIHALKVEQGRPKFIEQEKIDLELERVAREWNNL